MSKSNAPELRLDGFEDEWGEVRLGTIAREVKRVDPGSSAPVMMITARDGFVEQSSRYGFDNAGKSRQKYIELREGELAYNHGASKLRRFGSCFALQEPVALVPFVYHCFAVPNDDSAFMEYQLNDKSMEVQLGRLVSSGARMDGLLNISFEEYGTVLVKRPSLSEQQAIGDFFRRIDTTIGSHRKKLDLLKQTKTSLLQRMFPADGATVPELRLDGFEGEWAMVKLGSIAHMYQPHTISGEELQPSGIPVFGANGFIGFYHSANHQNDQVTISARGEKTGTPSYVPGPAWITGNSMVVNVDYADIDKRFLYADLGAMPLKKFVTGGAQPQLTREVLNEVEVPTPPTVEEQQAIGAVFAKLDTLISAEAQYIDKLTQTKTALLQKMFV